LDLTRVTMMTLLEEAFDDLACSIVGIGDKVERRANGQDPEQCKHFVKQSALVAIGPDQALMDARGKRHGEEALRRVDKQADGLQGMAHDVFGLGVGFRLLMQQLDGRIASARTRKSWWFWRATRRFIRNEIAPSLDRSVGASVR
jgi:hypothetical protein